MRAGHLIKAWSTTQTTIALSSAEAELSGIVKGAAQAIGLRSVAADLGQTYELELKTESTRLRGTLTNDTGWNSMPNWHDTQWAESAETSRLAALKAKRHSGVYAKPSHPQALWRSPPHHGHLWEKKRLTSGASSTRTTVRYLFAASWLSTARWPQHLTNKI